MSKPTRDEAEQAVRVLLSYIGEDPDRPGLLETPGRVIRAYSEMFSGYHSDPKIKLFQDDETVCNEMVISRDIEFYSTCEHHMLPFHGVAHIGYIPNDNRIIGLSKLARILDVFSRRLQVQERLTHQVAQSLWQAVEPKGVGVVVEARHFCMVCRGARKQNSTMVTSNMMGVFLTIPEVRSEFLRLCKISD